MKNKHVVHNILSLMTKIQKAPKLKSVKCMTKWLEKLDLSLNESMHGFISLIVNIYFSRE